MLDSSQPVLPSVDRLLLPPSSLEQPVRDFIRQCVAALQRANGESLLAVLLTGSLARGEGMVLREADRTELLSDIDLYAVTSDGLGAHDAGSLLRELGRPAWLRSHLELSTVAPNYFANLGSTLPAAQMARSMRTLWSSPQAPQLCPREPDRIDPDDALRLIQNRCGEFLHARAVQPPDPIRLQYAQFKLLVDLPLAFLSAHGRFLAGQRSRWMALGALLDGIGSSQLPGNLARLQRIWSLAERAELGADDLPGAELPAELAPELREWVGVLYLATLDAGSKDSDPTRALSSAARTWRGSWARLRSQWLRRRGLWRTLREARRWAALGPHEASAWWRYGAGGSGHDRVLWAVTETLVRGEHSAADPLCANMGERKLAEFWSTWILGNRRA